MHPDNPTADRLTGGILFVLGISMLVGGYTMDRLEIRHIHPASIPGLVPMGLGMAMAICALLLIMSTRRQHPESNSSSDDSVDTANSNDIGDVKAGIKAGIKADVKADVKADEAGSLKNLCVTALISVAYAAGLVGRIPFVAATAVFIFSFAVYFLWPSGEAENKITKGRLILLCAAYAGIFSTGISVLFRYGFLVRLP